MAMKLHTKDQAPKEGGQAAAPKPFPKVGIFEERRITLGSAAICAAAMQHVCVVAQKQHECLVGGDLNRATLKALRCSASAVAAHTGRLPEVPGGVEDAVRNPGGHRASGPAPRL